MQIRINGFRAIMDWLVVGKSGGTERNTSRNRMPFFLAIEFEFSLTEEVSCFRLSHSLVALGWYEKKKWIPKTNGFCVLRRLTSHSDLPYGVHLRAGNGDGGAGGVWQFQSVLHLFFN